MSSTAQSPSSTPSRASSRSPRRSGGRPTSTRSRGSRSSTRWTAPARTSSPPCSRCTTASARTRCPCRSRSARRTSFAASIDLVEMQAIVYKDDLGQEFDVGEIPAELAEQAHEYHHQLIDTISHFDDEVLEAYIEDESSVTPDQIRRALRAGTLSERSRPVLLGSAFKNKGVQPLLDAVIDYLPSPLDVPPMHGIDPKTQAEELREPSLDAPFSALAFKVMSDPYVGKLTYFRVYSGKLKAGDRVLNTTTGQDRARRPHPSDAREPSRGARGDRRRRDRGGRRPQGDDDRRHAFGRSAPDRARVDDLSGSGDLGRRRAEVEGRPGQARSGPRAPRRGGSDVPCHLRRGDRADAHRRDGRAAPRDHRRPAQARVQRRRQRRSAAGRLPRDRLAPRREHPRQVRAPDGRLGSVRRRRRSTCTRRSPAPATSSRTRSSAARSRRSTSPRSTPASRRRWARASSPATRSSTSGSS